MSGLSSCARVCIRLTIVESGLLSGASKRAFPLSTLNFHLSTPCLADGGMTLNLRMLCRIDQGEEVEAADGAVGGDLAHQATASSARSISSKRRANLAFCATSGFSGSSIRSTLSPVSGSSSRSKRPPVVSETDAQSHTGRRGEGN